MNTQRKTLLLAIGFLIYCAWNLYYLDKYPLIDLDDACMAEPAWSFVKTGHFSAPSFEGSYGLEKSDIYHGRLYMLAIAPYFKLFGLGVYQSRIDSFITGLFILLLTYLIAKRMFSDSVALKSAILLSLSGLFIICAHRARQEMLLTLFILLSFYLYLVSIKAEKGKFAFAFISGLLAGLSTDIHLNGVIVPLMLVSLFIYEYKLKFLKEKGFWLCMAGVAVGMLWWVTTHILMDVNLFNEQWNGFVMKEIGTPGAQTGFNPFHLVKNELKRYIFWFWSTTAHRNMAEFILLVPGIAGAFLKNEKNRNILFICVLSFLVMFTLIVSQKAPYYILLFLPFVFILFARGLENLKPALSKTVFGLLIAFYIVQLCFIGVKYRDVNYDNYASRVKAFIPPDKTLLGDTILWFTFSEQKFYSELTYSYYQKITKNPLESYLKEKNIEYVVFGKDQIGSFVDSEYFRSSYIQIAEVSDKFFGSGGMLSGKRSYQTLIYQKKGSHGNRKIPA